LIKLAESREKAITKRDKTEGKVISKINSLEQKNINLMQLVNKLKRKGIDVDNCWAQN
jgi:translation initiation factor 1 (eIF-1/SUI1)